MAEAERRVAEAERWGLRYRDGWLSREMGGCAEAEIWVEVQRWVAEAEIWVSQ